MVSEIEFFVSHLDLAFIVCQPLEYALSDVRSTDSMNVRHNFEEIGSLCGQIQLVRNYFVWRRKRRQFVLQRPEVSRAPWLTQEGETICEIFHVSGNQSLLCGGVGIAFPCFRLRLFDRGLFLR